MARLILLGSAGMFAVEVYAAVRHFVLIEGKPKRRSRWKNGFPQPNCVARNNRNKFHTSHFGVGCRFDKPIKLPSGRMFHTFREAGEHIICLSKSQRSKQAWLNAIHQLIEAAEGRRPIIFAQIAVNHAINQSDEPRYGPGKVASPEMTFHRARKPARDR